MKYKCIICGNVFDGGLYEDPCPCCKWIPIHKDDVSNEDEYDCINDTTIREAKKLYSKGLNRFGEPLKNNSPKKHPD